MIGKRVSAELVGKAVVATLVFALAACGGGGGGGGSSTDVSTGASSSSSSGGAASSSSSGGASSSSSSGGSVSTNGVGKVFENGVYHLWGFGVISNGVPQAYIARCGLSAADRVECKKTFGLTAGVGEIATPFDVVSSQTAPLYYVNDGVATNPYALRFAFPSAANSADLTLRFVVSPDRNWTISLKSTDISGLTVASQLKKTDGSLVSTTLAAPSTIFPPGSLAYTSLFTAKEPMLLQGIRLFISNSESSLMSSGWCAAGVNGKARPAVQINSDNTVSIFTVTSTCSFNGLTAIASGTWSKRVSGSNAYYKITYPDSLKVGEFAKYFTSGSSLEQRMDNYVVSEGNGTRFFTAIEALPGDTLENLQPYFNAIALPALRSAAGI